jgi:hypothetical protein
MTGVEITDRSRRTKDMNSSTVNGVAGLSIVGWSPKVAGSVIYQVKSADAQSSRDRMGRMWLDCSEWCSKIDTQRLGSGRSEAPSERRVVETERERPVGQGID